MGAYFSSNSGTGADVKNNDVDVKNNVDAGDDRDDRGITQEQIKRYTIVVNEHAKIIYGSPKSDERVKMHCFNISSTKRIPSASSASASESLSLFDFKAKEKLFMMTATVGSYTEKSKVSITHNGLCIFQVASMAGLSMCPIFYCNIGSSNIELHIKDVELTLYFTEDDIPQEQLYIIPSRFEKHYNIMYACCHDKPIKNQHSGYCTKQEQPLDFDWSRFNIGARPENCSATSLTSDNFRDHSDGKEDTRVNVTHVPFTDAHTRNGELPKSMQYYEGNVMLCDGDCVAIKYTS